MGKSAKPLTCLCCGATWAQSCRGPWRTVLCALELAHHGLERLDIYLPTCPSLAEVVIPSPSVRPTLAYRRLLLTHRCKRAQGLRREAACVPRRHPLCCQVDSRWTDWRVSASPPPPPLPSPVNPTLASSYLMNPFTAAQSGPYLFVFLASVKHILCFCSASNLQDNLSQIL